MAVTLSIYFTPQTVLLNKWLALKPHSLSGNSRHDENKTTAGFEYSSSLCHAARSLVLSGVRKPPRGAPDGRVYLSFSRGQLLFYSWLSIGATMAEVASSTPGQTNTQDLKITEEKVLPL